MRIFDNHIPEVLREELVHDSEYTSRPLAAYSFWDMKEFFSPQSVIQKALHHIWKDIIDPDDYIDGGIEWWINKSNGHAANRWHLDIIEHRNDIRMQEEYNSADLTVAYYPYVNCLGGYLEILDNERSNDKEEFLETLRLLNPSTQVERIKPVTNRAVFYDSHRIHRVSEIFKGQRDCLASSIWKKKPLTFNKKK